MELDEENLNGQVLKSTAELGFEINRLLETASADPQAEWTAFRNKTNLLLAAAHRNQAGLGFRDIADLELKIIRLRDEAEEAKTNGNWKALHDCANDILTIDHRNAVGLSLKAEAKRGRQINRLLENAE